MSKRQADLDAIFQELDSAEPSAAAAAAPVSSAPAKPKASEGGVLSDIAQGARDAASSVWRGAAGALNEATDTVNSIEKWIGEKTGLTAGYLSFGGPGFITWHREQREKAQLVPDALIPAKSESVTGQLIESATQFGVGMIGAGKFLKLAGVPAAVSVAGKVATEAVKGAVVDMSVFDEHENRISNIIQEHPGIANPVTEFLVSTKEDSFAVAKLKQGVEGMLSGVAFDALIGGLKILKKSRVFRDAPNPKIEKELIDTFAEYDEILTQAEKGAKYSVIETDKGFQIKVKGQDEYYPISFQTKPGALSEAATLNTLEIEKAKIQPAGRLTPEQTEALKTEASRLASSTDPEDVKKLLEGTDFNYLRVSNEEDAKKWIESMSAVMREQIDNARGGPVVTHKMLLQQIRDTFPDGDPEEILSALSRTYDNASDMSVNFQAGRVLMYKVGKQVSDLSKLVDGDPDNSLNLARLGEALDSLFTVTAQVKGIQTQTARTLQAMSIDVADAAQAVGVQKNPASLVDQAVSVVEQEATKKGPESLAARKILASLEGMTPEQMRTLARRIRMADGDPSEILAVMKSAPKAGAKPGVAAWHNELWMNAILSGKALFVNPVSNLLRTIADPMEKWFAGAVNDPVERFTKGTARGSQQLRQEGADLLVGNFMHLRESWAMAYKSLKIGENILDPQLPTNEVGAVHAIQGYLGQLVRVPSKILMAEDEFFKQMAYRSNVRMSALRDGRELGKTGEALAEYVNKAMQAAFRPDGRGINKAALGYSQDITFTKGLNPDSIMADVQSMVAKHPALRVILPFVRTPVNIIDYVWERTPIVNLAMKQVREDLKAGGERAAMATAKMGTGIMLYSTAAYLALNKTITGKGPSDPKLREQWKQAGMQPYSIRVGDKWVEYKRLDPLLTPLGIAADMVAASGEMDEDEYSDLVLAFAASTANNLTSKTYLMGLTNVMEALTSGSPTRMRDFFENQAGSYVPAASNQGNPDDTQREIRGYVDAVLGRLPGFSETLPARRNLFGEPIMKAPGSFNRLANPMTVGAKPKGDGALEEKLLEIGKALPTPSKYAPGTDDLGPSLRVDMSSRKYGLTKDGLTPYDRMLQLTAEPGRGPSLREALTKLVMNPEWDELSPGASVSPGGTRYELAKNIIESYRQRAYMQMLKEFPAVQMAVVQAQQTKKVAKYKGEEGVQRVLEMFNKE